MLRLISRKLLLMLVLLPLLNAVGFNYALIHPSFFAPRVVGERAAEGGYYRAYLQGVLQGDFGKAGSADMLTLLGRPLLNSLILIGLAIIITAVMGVLLGFWSVSAKTSRIRPWGLFLTTAGASIPGFLLGGVVISIIVYQTLYGNITEFPLPMSGFGLDSHLILPLVVLAVRPTLHVAKVTSGLLEDELQKDYIRSIRSLGARWSRVFWRHAWRNIFSAVTVVVGQSLRFIVGGLMIAEVMFSWPGIGRLLAIAIVASENFRGQFQYFANPALIAALAVVMGFLLLSADLIATVVAYVADPRVRDIPA